MLKNCISKSTNFANSKFFNTKCGEVICQSESCFAIICEYCELKLFDFDDFLQHFRNVHFDFESQLKSQNNSTKDSINCNETKIEQTDSSENFTENVLQTTASGDTECVSLKREIDIFEHHILLDNRVVYDGDNSVHESDIVKEQNYNEEDCMELDESECSSAEDEDWYPHKRNVYNAKESRLSQISQKFQQNVDTNLEAEEDDIPHSIIRDPVVPAKTPTKKQHKCEFCNKVYTTAKTLKIHTKIKHIKPKTHKCTNCEEAFLDTRSLNSHIKKKHTTYACSNCDRTYKNAESLRVHLLNHKNVKDFVCPYDNCSKAFVSQRRLKVHIEIHTDKRNYVCEVCGYRSRSKHALEVHKRGHTGEKPFKCPNCDRSFASKSLVNEHQAMHMTDRPFKCEVCDATFARPKALYHHKHLHLAEKKFKCKLCGSAYAQAAGLSAHMRQHRLEDAGLA